MNILITGGTGLIGTHLIKHATKHGHTVSVLNRGPSELKTIKRFNWNPAEGVMDENALKETDCIVHLAGASLAEGRWTEKRKKEIIDSRVKSGELLYNHLKENRHAVKTFISVSGIGIYGNTGDLWVDETAEHGNDFISDVCKAWEGVANKIISLGIRVVIVRMGVVLAKEGGALPAFAKPVKLFVGASLGSGKQYISWIHIEDACHIFLKGIEDDTMKGIYNAVAPNPRTNIEFTKTLATVLRRRLWLPRVPDFILRLVLGEKATIVLEGQRVLAKRIKLTAFQFQFRELGEALKNIYNKK